MSTCHSYERIWPIFAEATNELTHIFIEDYNRRSDNRTNDFFENRI